MAEKNKKSEGFREETSKHVLAYIECHKAISESFIKATDTYISEHNMSEEEDGWSKDLPNNAFKAAKEFLRCLSKEPQKAFDKYFKEPEEESEEEGSSEASEEKSEEEGSSEASEEKSEE